MPVKDWSTNPDLNTFISGIDIQEGCEPGNLNNATRQVMADVAAVIGVAGIGYITGQGGTVTQATSKATNVTINTLSGQITMNASSLAAGASVAFFMLNSHIAATDLVIVQLNSAGGGAHGIIDYSVRVGQAGAGSVGIVLKNEGGGALAETVVLNFAVIKAVIA